MIDRARTGFEVAYAGSIDLPLHLPEGCTYEDIATGWRDTLSEQLYGTMPEAPEDITCIRKPLSASNAERLELNIKLPDGNLAVDAALWLPQGSGPWPLICGLDFLGPAGILVDTEFPLDQEAIVSPRPELGMYDGKLSDVVRAMSGTNWPVALLNDAGYAVIVSCYGSWVPDHSSQWRKHGLKVLIKGDIGAISLWAWAYSRLIDAASSIEEINVDKVVVAGHSRLGKAALWAAANDRRIRATFASSSGAAGAAPSTHPVGETLQQLHERFPHWLRTDVDLSRHDYDQHMLLALAAPNAVYLAGAEEDLWADPLGSYVALTAASQAWPGNKNYKWPSVEAAWQPGRQIIAGSLGFHLRSGGHALLPYDWRQFLHFLDQQYD